MLEVVSRDDGQGSLRDGQYFAFTLVGLAYFTLQVITHPKDGLPAMPDALLVLVGISAAGYLADREVERRDTSKRKGAQEEKQRAAGA